MQEIMEGLRLAPRKVRAAVGYGWFLALAVGCAPAGADTGLRLGGFGTLGYSADNRSDIAPARDIGQLPAQGSATGPSWKLDTRIGLQLEYPINATLDLLGQVVLRDHFRATPDSSTELAYAAIKPDAATDLRVGRINYDAFLMSDHRNVGYAYPWVRPPAEFYGWIPIFSLDGVDGAYRIRSGEADWRLKVQAGQARVSIPIVSGYDFVARQLLGASVSRQSGPWRLKAAYSRFTVGSEVNDFIPMQQGLEAVAAAGVPQVSAEAADLRQQVAFQNARISYTTLAAAYDDGVWVGQAELGYSTSTRGVVPHGRMAYVSLGRRVGPWTPMVLLAASRPGNAVRAAAADWGSLNATLRDRALFVLNTTRIEQKTLSLGVRWDFSSRAALKLQWDTTVVQPSGYGLWWRDNALNMQTSRIQQLSATVDFVF